MNIHVGHSHKVTTGSMLQSTQMLSVLSSEITDLHLHRKTLVFQAGDIIADRSYQYRSKIQCIISWSLIESVDNGRHFSLIQVAEAICIIHHWPGMSPFYYDIPMCTQNLNHITNLIYQRTQSYASFITDLYAHFSPWYGTVTWINLSYSCSQISDFPFRIKPSVQWIRPFKCIM